MQLVEKYAHNLIRKIFVCKDRWIFKVLSCFLLGLTVSIRSENFASIRLGFPEPSILNKCAQYYQVKISHSYMIVQKKSHFRSVSRIRLFQKNIRFWLLPPKDAEPNFRGGPWGNSSISDSFKADRA